MAVRVRPIGFGRGAAPFIDVQWRVYRDDPSWIPVLRRVQRDRLDPSRTPFLTYGRAQLFIVERDGEPVGRISAQTNPLHDAKWGERAGFFGYYDCIDDREASAALFGAAEDWLRGQGAEFARGPISFSLNDEAGCLVEGFDAPPMVAMPHGRPWFGPAIEAVGYEKAKDLWAYRYPVASPLEPRRRGAYDRIHAMDEVTVRPFEKRRLRRDVRLATRIYNEAWSENWGAIPITDAEADELAHSLSQFADPGLTAMVEIEGEPAAMVIAIPNLTEASRDLDGRMLPFGWAKLAWRLPIAPLRGRLESGRVMLLGVRPKFRTRRYMHLGAMLMAEVHVRGRERGYQWAELGWVLEDNRLLNSALARTDARVHRVYRIYQKPL